MARLIANYSEHPFTVVLGIISFMKKSLTKKSPVFFLLLVPLTLIIIVVLFMCLLFWNDLRVDSNVFFPLHDEKAEYSILCKEVYYLSSIKNGDSFAIAISKSQQNLEEFCDKKIIVNLGRPNYLYTHPLCRNQDQLCKTSKAATFELENISLK